MRYHGTISAARFSGIAGINQCASQGLGAIPANLQNALYAVGSPGSNFNDVINNATWNTLRANAVPYPPLPYAGPNGQNPWGTTVVTTPSAPVIVPAGGGGSSGGGSGAPRHVNLQGLGDTTPIAAFPMTIRNPDITGNTFWYTGQPVLNKGVPKFSNDAGEWLRHAMVDSNWDDVELWMAWALNNGMTPAQLQQFDFGKYKYTQSASNQAKKFYPFSYADYSSFFERFMKYASNVKVDKDCLQGKLELYKKAVNSSPRNQFQLNLSNCPLTTPWYVGLMRAVAIIAIPAALAAGAAAIAGAASTAGTGAAGAAGAGSASAGGAAATAAIPTGIEVVTVTAAAPAITAGTAATVAAGISAGAVAVAAAPPPISSPSIPAPGIETVTTTASTLPAGTTVGQALVAGSVATAAAAPAILPPSIETVQVEAPRIEQHPVDAAETAATGLLSVGIEYPGIDLQEPGTPDYDQSLTDKIKSNLQDAAESYGSDWLQQHLKDWLAGQLGRDPTPGELQQYEDYLNPDSPGALLRKALPWIIFGIALTAVVASKKKNKRSPHPARRKRKH